MPRLTLPALVVLPLLLGCPSMATLQTARTTGAGNLQVAVEPSFWAATGEDGTDGIPHLNLAIRYGASDRIDIGGRLGTSAIELGGKLRLTDATDSFVLSVAPSFGGLVLGSAGGGLGIFNAQVPVLLGVPVGRSEIVLGPKVVYLGVLGAGEGGGAAIHVVSAGASAGFAWRAGHRFTLVPEVAIATPVWVGAGAAFAGSSSALAQVDGSSTVFFQVGLALVVGGD